MHGCGNALASRARRPALQARAQGVDAADVIGVMVRH